MNSRTASRTFVTLAALAVLAFAAPSIAMADGTFAWPTGQSSHTVNSPAPRTSSVAPSSGYKTPSKSYYKPTYSSYCYTCSSYLDYDRSSYFNLSFDFSDNDIDQSVHNNITNNVNVNGDNNNVGINNSQETNQNAGISTSRGYYEHRDRSSYYDYFSRFNSSSNGTSGNNSAYGNQSNNANQNNIFNTGSSKKSKDHDDDDIWCELEASDRTVEEGDRITLSWETENADDARINQGIGRVDEDGDSIRVRIDDTTTFRMTVENDDGDEADCSVTVRVEDDDDNNFSGVVINEEPTINPYSGVYLSEIPYTGLDMGPYAWAYWAAIAGVGAAGAYVFFFMGIPFVLRRATAIGEEVETELAEEENTNVQQSVMSIPAAVTSTGTAVVSSQSEIENFAEALVDGDSDTASEILENATQNGASASVFLNRASALLRSGSEITKGIEASVIAALVESLETAAKARA